ncbi:MULTISPECIES: menaquinone biosynthetic enzyme MqnA/MqnD family protein [Chitinophagaceae]
MILKKIKVGAVSYLNARPLIYGIKGSDILKDEMEIVEEYPSKLVKMLIEDEIDMGLVSTASIPFLKTPHIVSDYVIAATGDVASVCLFSQVPIEEIDTVLLDYQSRTSINLCKVLMQFYWKKEVKFILTRDEYAHQIRGKTAGVIIGDRALIQRPNFPYIYDFAREWTIFTGKPFVFAAWIANKEIPESFLQKFSEANSHWAQYIDQIITEHPFPVYDLRHYFTYNINYEVTQEMKDGLELFLDYMKNIETV